MPEDGKATTPGIVSVVIPTLNSEATLISCLNSLKNETYANVEVLIVDGGSTDATIEIGQAYGAIVLKGNLPRSAARRAGAALASGDYLLFLDADQSIEREVIRDAVQTCRDAHARSVVIPEIGTGDGVWAACRNLDRMSVQGTDLSYPRFFSRDTYWQVGGHRMGLESFMEDRDLFLRVVASGVAIGAIHSRIVNLADPVNPLTLGIRGLKSAADSSTYYSSPRAKRDALMKLVAARLAALIIAAHNLRVRRAEIIVAMPLYLTLAYGPRFILAGLSSIRSLATRAWRSP